MPSWPGWRAPRGSPTLLGAAPSASLLRNQGRLGHPVGPELEDAPNVEISELHIGVKPHDSLDGLHGWCAE